MGGEGGEGEREGGREGTRGAGGDGPTRSHTCTHPNQPHPRTGRTQLGLAIKPARARAAFCLFLAAATRFPPRVLPLGSVTLGVGAAAAAAAAAAAFGPWFMGFCEGGRRKEEALSVCVVSGREGVGGRQSSAASKCT
jgi:hypothetical protein